MSNARPERCAGRRRVAIGILVLLLGAGALPAQSGRAPRLKGGADFVLPITIEGAEGMEVHLHLPPGWKKKSKKQFPVLLALHGNGQAPQSAFRKHRPLSQKKTPLIVMAPKYQKEKRFNAERWPQEVCLRAFDQLRERAITEWHGDPDRFFVQGFSMGGSYSCLYLAHAVAALKEGEVCPIRAVILNSGRAFSSQMKWPERVPLLFVVGEKETAVLGKINMVKEMRDTANLLFRAGRDVRYHEIPGMKHAVNQACLEFTRAVIFEECGPERKLGKDVAAFRKRLQKKEQWPVSRLHRFEQRARGLPDGKPAERLRQSIGQLYDLPAMVKELEAWKQLQAAVEADKPGSAAARAAYAAVVKAHPRTEAGRRAQARLTWLD